MPTRKTPGTPRPLRSPAPRAGRGPGTRLAALVARVTALEERVARLETGRASPGDGRASVAKRPRLVRRCPGCGLPLRQRKGRCLACGRPVASL